MFVFTHDSVGVGEDGPTHQPIEHLAAAAGHPRPAGDPAGRRQRDGGGVADRRRPRRPDRARPEPPERAGRAPTARAVERRRRPSCATPTSPQLVLVGTGSEVAVCVDAAERSPTTASAGTGGVACRGGTASSRQPDDVPSRACCPPGVPVLSVEAAATFGWERWADDVDRHRPLRGQRARRGRARRARHQRRPRRRPEALLALTRRGGGVAHGRVCSRLYDEHGQSPWLDNLKRGYLTSRPAGRAARRRHPRPHVEPDDLPEGDPGLGRLRRAVRRRSSPTARTVDRRLLGAGAARHPRRARRVRPGVRRRPAAPTASSASRSTPTWPTTPTAPTAAARQLHERDRPART